ncbi:MAG: hypothetical protein AB9872_16590 [Solidesulfovibrio sp.]
MKARPHTGVGPASALLVAVLLLSVLPCRAQDLGGDSLLESEDEAFQYTLTLSGTVGNETFTEARGLLTVSFPVPGSQNPYQIITVGFPTANSRNTFYWSSEEGPMEALSGSIRSRITGRGQKLSSNHFFFLSPKLFALKGALTQQEAERIKQTEKMALPTKIFAQAGEMTLNLTKSRLTGRVVMTGIDPASNEYVRYAASFEGQREQGPKTTR